VRDTELYARTGAVPALPQVYTWVVAEASPTPIPQGRVHIPTVATLDGVDAALAEALPAMLLVGRGIPDPAGFPLFGPLLSARYERAAATEEWRLYRLRDAPPP
jgi:hypothetical protein